MMVRPSARRRWPLGLLIVFATVNVSVLVLRRENVPFRHFTSPTAMPVIGAAVSLALMTTKDAETFGRAAVLLAVGALLWVVTRKAAA